MLSWGRQTVQHSHVDPTIFLDAFVDERPNVRLRAYVGPVKNSLAFILYYQFMCMNLRLLVTTSLQLGAQVTTDDRSAVVCKRERNGTAVTGRSPSNNSNTTRKADVQSENP